MKMYTYEMTVGLLDKDEEIQLIANDAARGIITNLLIKHNVDAFTLLDCEGVYRMESTGNIIREPSIRIEIARDKKLKHERMTEIIESLKTGLNQESIMLKIKKQKINFI